MVISLVAVGGSDGLLEASGLVAGKVAVFSRGLGFREGLTFSPDFTFFFLLLRIAAVDVFLKQIQGAVGQFKDPFLCWLVQCAASFPGGRKPPSVLPIHRHSGQLPESIARFAF
jgi:hypothetical protein